MKSGFFAHFDDGSWSPIDIKGSYGRSEQIGLAQRGDGYKCVVFFDSADDFLIPHDGNPWIRNISRQPGLT